MKNYLICLAILIGAFLPPIYGQNLSPDLKYLIEKAQKKNYTNKVYQHEANQAKIDERLAKSVLLPKVSVSGSYTRLDSPISLDNNMQGLLYGLQKVLIKEKVGIPFNVPFPEKKIPLKEIPDIQDENILKSSVDLDWVIFSGFKVTNAIKASRNKQEAIKYKEMANQDKIALKIIDNYNKLALVIASEKVLASSEKYLNKQRNFVNKAVKNGLATPIERKKIELAQQQLATKQLEITNNKTLLIELLHQLTGEDKSFLNNLSPSLQLFSTNIEVDNKKRNEIKALEKAQQATLYQSKMERNDFIPKVAIKGHYELIDDNLTLLDPKWYVAVGVKWNIFNGNQSNLKAQKAFLESEKYEEKRTNAEELIQLSITKASLDLQAANQTIVMVQKEVDLTNSTLELLNKQYKNNLTTISEVLETLNEVEKSNFKLQKSYYNQYKAGVNLLYAKGNLTY